MSLVSALAILAIELTLAIAGNLAVDRATDRAS